MPECIIHINHAGIVNKAAVKKFFAELKEGKYLLNAKSIKKRTLPQNSYYWGCVVPMVKNGLRDAGYNEVKTNDDAHEILKHLFLKRKVESDKTGDVIVIAGSTAKLHTVEFNAYLEEIWQWASEYLCLTIPGPNEQIPMYE